MPASIALVSIVPCGIITVLCSSHLVLYNIVHVDEPMYMVHVDEPLILRLLTESSFFSEVKTYSVAMCYNYNLTSTPVSQCATHINLIQHVENLISFGMSFIEFFLAR